MVDSIFIGLDAGSTTVKLVVLNQEGEILFKAYERHLSLVHNCALGLFKRIPQSLLNLPSALIITGSAGMALAEEINAPFIQEVIACNLAIQYRYPDADAIIELGGEDAKLTFLTGGVEQKMNETCAGGTGAFIDQMAAFIGVDAQGLDVLAANHDAIYPIASRCGVFAKSDLLPLLNEGCRKENIAASIMEAVVNQTIGGLAQGRPIQGKIVFLGGPPHFLKSLRKHFAARLEEMTEAIHPDDGHFFTALGAAINAKEKGPSNLMLFKIIERLAKAKPQERPNLLRPLFSSQVEIDKFRARHEQHSLKQLDISTSAGKAWLGIDCGSTTIKTVLINEDGDLLFSSYFPNRGNPIKSALRILNEIYTKKSPFLTICGACATGYGGPLLAAGLHLDMEEVETIAHYTAAAFFDPQVSFILDIGGQDIKCLYISNGHIERIQLNEACSAGCGSFVENFSNTLGLALADFIDYALHAPNPVDLGTRCTVFMNSRVRQAQKEGVDIANIAAGLAYSVARNAIYKVIKITDISELGSHIIAQGGAFLNDALLRALELELGRPVIRPAMPGLMGAFGAALIAKKRAFGQDSSTIIKKEELESFKVKTSSTRCKGCSNSCHLTVSHFNDGKKFISGNRCERGADAQKNDLPNLSAWKYQRLFAYKPLALDKAWRGSIGLPRALNIFENYPLWFTLFTVLGFRVELSDPSSKELYYSAFNTIPSQTVCYPAKLAHGHILNLIQKNHKLIFFPCIRSEQKNSDFRHGLFNCPVVGGYPELIALNMEAIKQNGVNYIHDFLPLDAKKLPLRLRQIKAFADIPINEMKEAVNAAFLEMENYRKDLRKAGEEALQYLEKTQSLGIVLAGHPYHIDPEIHHGIPEIINACGMAVLTEDAISHLMPDPGPLRVVDQWAYHSRMYRAGAFSVAESSLGVLQLVSFGCGLDAITSDQLEEIVRNGKRMYAQIKIDEGANLGPAKIRIRSLRAAMRDSIPQASKPKAGAKPCCSHLEKTNNDHFPIFKSGMRNTHTLLIPQMSPLHFQFAKEIFASEGYDAVLLPHVDKRAVETGLKYVNNDACYPALIVVGQLLQAVKSGLFDANKTVLALSQTGGGCRATNYVAFLRKALVRAGLGQIPIANFSTTPHAPGIKLTHKLLSRLIMAGHYGDTLMRVTNRLRPYEKVPGSTQELASIWSGKAAQNIENGNLVDFQKNIFALVRDFDNLPLETEERKPRIGIVGEILLKYHPDANNHAVSIIENEGGEVISPDIMDFMLYCMYGQVFGYEHLDGALKNWFLAKAGIAWQEISRISLRAAFAKSKRFDHPLRFANLQAYGKKIISLGHQTGEGWLLAAEMMHLLAEGVSGILCIQPFGCLPNHIVGKGLIGTLRRMYPQTPITALDYDPGASEVNQMNRIKLMMNLILKNNHIMG